MAGPDVTARDDSRSRFAFAVLKTHREAVNSLIKCLKANPNQEKWIEALDATLNRYWPNIVKMNSKKHLPVSFELMDIINEARAAVSPTESNHQKAIDALVGISVSAFCDREDLQWSVPLSRVPALFRAAIEEMKAKGDKNPYREEIAILEVALPLLEHAKDENWAPEQKEFLAALVGCAENGKMRMRYTPEKATIN